MPTALQSLRDHSILVADTGNIKDVERLRPQDCTTNPSLVLAALRDPVCAPLVAPDLERCRSAGRSEAETADFLTARLCTTLAEKVPGVVSMEVDANLSFDTAAMVQKARALIALCEEMGLGRDRLLIKLAATWEGIHAGEILENEGTRCNLTLVFSLAQAVACAHAGIYLISPFVGRITDWHAAQSGRAIDVQNDPGVASVRRIFEHFKSRGIPTIVMAASFRTTDQVRALAGCDRLTIAPKLLDQLAKDHTPLDRQLFIPDRVVDPDPLTASASASEFRWQMNSDAMATEKLAEGLRSFDRDRRHLLDLISARLSEAVPS
ncbi:transaldolase family protein [Marinibacterium sp. SX1]|uniref:transaldolase family protein n=1 Tax=Marinibacterium sp. SX1 TaxID=3388424 RepID=UPI003D17130B